jgi:hypothetical protein
MIKNNLSLLLLIKLITILFQQHILNSGLNLLAHIRLKDNYLIL